MTYLSSLSKNQPYDSMENSGRVFQSLYLALNERGHEIVIFTANPMKNSSLSNYTEIDFSFLYKKMLEYKYDIAKYFSRRGVHFYSDLKTLYAKNSNKSFGTVIIEMIMKPALYALDHRFNAVIGKIKIRVY
ncbi:uncharacterized protein [Linepithema humile]|uniref:uncharacterized protein n=1 Tax=Linepithema humile TaxID=83485 RepID=UPI00351DDFC5